MPLLQQVFLVGIQLNQFMYLCHVYRVKSEAGFQMKCSGIEKAVSLCNIVIVTVACHFSLQSNMARAIEQVWSRRCCERDFFFIHKNND